MAAVLKKSVAEDASVALPPHFTVLTWVFVLFDARSWISSRTAMYGRRPLVVDQVRTRSGPVESAVAAVIYALRTGRLTVASGVIGCCTSVLRAGLVLSVPADSPLLVRR